MSTEKPFDYGSKRPDGQHERHPGLKATDPKDFVRPLRHSYKHTGAKPKYDTRELTAEEKDQYAAFNYVLFEKYPKDYHPSVGRFWTEAQMKAGCGQTTRMPDHCARTYAVNPKFYGSTFCCGCGTYHPIEEFVWINEDGTESAERVGS